MLTVLELLLLMMMMRMVQLLLRRRRQLLELLLPLLFLGCDLLTVPWCLVLLVSTPTLLLPSCCVLGRTAFINQQPPLGPCSQPEGCPYV